MWVQLYTTHETTHDVSASPRSSYSRLNIREFETTEKYLGYGRENTDADDHHGFKTFKSDSYLLKHCCCCSVIIITSMIS